MSGKKKNPAKYCTVFDYYGIATTSLANEHFCISYNCNDTTMWFYISPVIDIYGNGDLYVLPFIKTGHYKCDRKKATNTVFDWLRHSKKYSTKQLHVTPNAAYFDQYNSGKNKRRITCENYVITFDLKELDAKDGDRPMCKIQMPSSFNKFMSAPLGCTKINDWNEVTEYVCDGGANIEE